jgi:hypothetical protein
VHRLATATGLSGASSGAPAQAVVADIVANVPVPPRA